MANLNLSTPEWSFPLGTDFRTGEVSYSGFAKSEERGRQMAMRALWHNPTRRKQAEQIWGLAYVKNRYPELYTALADAGATD